MKILPVTPLFVSNLRLDKTEIQKAKVQNNTTYNPIAYVDYNVSFGEKLLLTPEEFYPWPCNKKGLPKRMKDYLNADYDDRQHVRPQDMLKIVYADIEEAKSLEWVKRHYSDEPLFQNLTDRVGKKATNGIIAEIDLMREEGKTLFKNGKDNLGLYLLKKIYVEGKTLKEINEDFKKDVSVHYSGLSPIKYTTLYAYGIKYPDGGFWKSFTHNRDNYKCEYKPRKPIQHKTETVTAASKSKSEPVQEKGRYADVKDWEIDKLADGLLKGNGNTSETRKRLKNSSVRDEASLNFVAKYMGEINSVVLEKLHVSPEMREFFENSDNISKSQKQKLEAYWNQDSERRELRSLIMKDTIRLFFDAYGVNGQNDEFKELLDYAHSIKPNRLAQLEKHNQLQAEYDEAFANFDFEKYFEEQVSEKNVQPETIEKVLDEVQGNLNVERYEFDNGKDKIVIVANLKEAYQEYLEKKTSLMPDIFAGKFIKFMTENSTVSDDYILSILVEENNISLPKDSRVMDKDKAGRLTTKLQDDFLKSTKKLSRAAEQAIADVYIGLTPEKDLTSKILAMKLFDYILLQEDLSSDIQDMICSKKAFINSKYNEYKPSLNSRDADRVFRQIVLLLKNYSPTEAMEITPLNDILEKYLDLYSSTIKKSGVSPKFKAEMLTFLKEEYGGSARFLLNSSMPEELRMAKMEQLMLDFIIDNANKNQNKKD